MSSPFPPETFDLIVDFLDDLDALEACCLVSKSWIHRTRKYLFSHVEFMESDSERWQKIFPDPSNSPAHYARSLSICADEIFTLVDTGAGDWIRAFSGVIRLELGFFHSNISLAPLHGLFPTLKSLRVSYRFSRSSSEMFGLVCSFPLLEDLTLYSPNDDNEDEWDIPSTSPRLTGSLDLTMLNTIGPAVRRLLELPSGLHFSKIDVSYEEEDFESMMDLVSSCSDTLESLSICCDDPGDENNTLLVDLSKLTKLKGVALGCSDIQRITMTLRTAESITLEEIVISSPSNFRDQIAEWAYPEWQNLDHLLLQFWTSRSTRLKIMYKQGGGGIDLVDAVPRLFPELTSRGVIDLIDIDKTFPDLDTEMWE